MACPECDPTVWGSTPGYLYVIPRGHAFGISKLFHSHMTVALLFDESNGGIEQNGKYVESIFATTRCWCLNNRAVAIYLKPSKVQA